MIHIRKQTVIAAGARADVKTLQRTAKIGGFLGLVVVIADDFGTTGL